MSGEGFLAAGVPMVFDESSVRMIVTQAAPQCHHLMCNVRKSEQEMNRLIVGVNSLVYLMTMAKTIDAAETFRRALELARGRLVGSEAVSTILRALVEADRRGITEIDRLVPSEVREQRLDMLVGALT